MMDPEKNLLIFYIASYSNREDPFEGPSCIRCNSTPSKGHYYYHYTTTTTVTTTTITTTTGTATPKKQKQHVSGSSKPPAGFR